VSKKRGRPPTSKPADGTERSRKNRAKAARILYRQRKEWLRRLRRDPWSLVLEQAPAVAVDRNGPNPQIHRYVPGVATVTSLGDDSFVEEDGWQLRKLIVRSLEPSTEKQSKAKRTKKQ
jgi:hypothetical protein